VSRAIEFGAEFVFKWEVCWKSGAVA
jgi:hypothetical protein